ncbi:MAG: NADH-quinone oxidoreductase subunit J [Alphaproteobacteria bacterium]|nr:NADH-quinone oxidoreductase subunit J [Alphaproteobacteria bacterium]
MLIQSLAFYLFASVAIASGVMVISARNTVHAVLFLILAFFNAAGLFVLLGAEFLAMILIIVYVGAVAVLFLFVVMMLDVDTAAIRQGFLNYLPVGLLVGALLLGELAAVFGGWVLTPGVASKAPALDNTEALGRVLYTDYAFLFIGASMVLLLAMIGAIVLTFRQRAGVRRQDAATQINRRRDQAIELRKLASGSGA